MSGYLNKLYGDTVRRVKKDDLKSFLKAAGEIRLGRVSGLIDANQEDEVLRECLKELEGTEYGKVLSFYNNKGNRSILSF